MLVSSPVVTALECSMPSGSKMFFRAKEGSRAMLVNYPKKNEEDKGIPVDVIVYKDADME